MTKLLTVLFILSFLMGASRLKLKAQEKSDRDKEIGKVYRGVLRAINPSSQYEEACNSFYGTIKVAVYKKKVDSVLFINDVPNGLLTAPNRLDSALATVDWCKIYPEKADRFTVFIPFQYAFEIDGCYDKIDEKKIKATFSNDINNRKGTDPYYEFERVKINYKGKVH